MKLERLSFENIKKLALQSQNVIDAEPINNSHFLRMNHIEILKHHNITLIDNFKDGKITYKLSVNLYNASGELVDNKVIATLKDWKVRKREGSIENFATTVLDFDCDEELKKKILISYIVEFCFKFDDIKETQEVQKQEETKKENNKDNKADVKGILLLVTPVILTVILVMATIMLEMRV